MISNRRYEEVMDPNVMVKPSTKALKRALLIALRCLDPDSEKRPKMGQVVRMLDSDEYSMSREVRFLPSFFLLFLPFLVRHNRWNATLLMGVLLHRPSCCLVQYWECRIIPVVRKTFWHSFPARLHYNITVRLLK